MSRIKNLVALSFMVFMLTPPACSSSPSSSGGTATVVTDTLGWRYNVNCSSGLCVLTCTDPDIVAKSCTSGSGADAFLLVVDPLLSIYAVLVQTSGQVELSAANPSRPVACATDADCQVPGIIATGTYACTNQLCQCASAACATPDGKSLANGGMPLTYDVLTLCQADIAWPTQCPYIASQPFASRISEVATACGSKDTCATVPADCRQLTAAAPVPDGGGQPTAVDSSVDSGL